MLEYKHGNNIMDMENSKRNKPHKFILNLLQRLDLRSSNKHIALQDFITRGKI